MKLGISYLQRQFACAAAFGVVSCLAVPATAAPQQLRYPNGVSATVYSTEDLASRLSTYQGMPAIQLPDGRFLPVVTDINDPSIHNKGDGAFHPFTREHVDATLSAVSHPRLALGVRVYLLPYPRRGVLVSSTTGNEIFLSPHVLDIDPAVAAYIIAHELGHVFHNRFMPSGSQLWGDYRALRGIADAASFHDGAAHANRPREIFAEDFRVLFGGPDAYFGGRVENTRIAAPEAVSGLDDFYLRVAVAAGSDSRLAATSYPNPFNPETEIRIVVPFDASERSEEISVRVYSVTGALVRELHQGVAAGDLLVRWDGKDERGNRVASATYYAQIRMGEERETLKLVLLK